MKKLSLSIWTVALIFAAAVVFGQTDKFFGQASPGPEPVKFFSETLHRGFCPHGQLAFAHDGSGAFWSAIALEGRQQTIYWSAFDGKTFSPPVVAPFAAASGNGTPSFSPDGRRLFFNVEIAGPEASSPKTMAICYVERAGDGWTKPVTIEATADVTMTKGQVSVARNGNLYFTGRILTERTPAIFLSRYVNGQYARPEKLSGPIAEEALLIVDPWIDPDERFMLVSCPPAEGPPMRNDIGISRRQADGTWSKPVRLGGPVNTQAAERFASLSADGKYLFFIRSYSQQFVGDQAHFYWVETKDIPELSIKQPSPERPKLSEKLSVLLPFIGATWRGSIPGDSRMGEITLKWEVLLNGFAAKLERVVLNANHRLETIYCWDESAGKIAFLAVSNNGFVTKGHVFGRGEEIICEGVQQGNDVNRMVRKIFWFDKEGKLNEEDQFRNEQTDEWRRIHVSVYEAK